MKFTTVQPIIQVAELSNMDDLEWVLTTLKERKLFHNIRVYDSYSDKQAVYDADSGLEIKKDKIVKVSYESGYGNSYDERTYSVARIGSFIVWNQNGEASSVFLERDGSFTKDHIPNYLLKNIVVDFSGK